MSKTIAEMNPTIPARKRSIMVLKPSAIQKGNKKKLGGSKIK